MIETRLLTYFLAVAREQNITRAAEVLHITQPTLSKQLMDLEEQLGKQLFIRGKRKITLTEEGAFLRGKAQEMLDLMEKTESAFHSGNEIIVGDIHLGCGETLSMEHITEIFRQIQNEYPDIHFHIYSADAGSVLEKLDKGLLDIGLLIGSERQEKYDYIVLPYTDTFGFLMPSDCPLAEKQAITIEDLSGLPLIFPAQVHSGQRKKEWFGARCDSLNITATYNLIYNAVFMVEKGMGYAFGLENLVDVNGRKNLTFRRFSPTIKVNLTMVTKRYQTFSPAVKLFIERIKDIL